MYFKCRLGTTKIVADSTLSPHPHFETDVAKIQEGITEETKIHHEYIHTYKPLLKSRFITSADSADSDEAGSGDENSDEKDIALEKKLIMIAKPGQQQGCQSILIVDLSWAVIPV